MPAAAPASVEIFGTSRQSIVLGRFTRGTWSGGASSAWTRSRKVCAAWMCPLCSTLCVSRSPVYEPFLVEPVETDAPARAGQIAQHAAVPDEGFRVDHGVDAATAGAPQKTQRVARERQAGMRVDGDDVLGRDDLEHLHARANLREAQKVQRRVRMELARLPQRGIGHDHRPHLGELNEQDVPRPAGGRGGQADQALDAADDREEKDERDPDPVVDGPHQVRSQSSLVSQRTVRPGPAPHAGSPGSTIRATTGQRRRPVFSGGSRIRSSRQQLTFVDAKSFVRPSC